MTKPDQLILYVDDERANRLVFEHTFSPTFRVKTVASAEEALQILKQEPVAVLVTDQRMPNMSGNDLLVRTKELYPEVVRIVITAYSDLDPILSAVNAGLVARYLIKPWDRLELEKILNWAVEAHALGAMNSALQLRLLETERLVTLGGIAAAIVHDIIQPLSHMTYNASFLLSHRSAVEELNKLRQKLAEKLGPKQLPPEIDESLKELIEELPHVSADLYDGCMLLTEIVTRLRTLIGAVHQLDDDGPTEADPLSVIRYAIKVCRVVAEKAEADFSYDGPTEIPNVAMDSVELTQTMINILSNAAHSLRESEKARGHVLVSAADMGEAVRIVVADNGVGMSNETLAKLGTPFFSTRPNGTGLGVMQCRRFIEKAGGKLAFQSQEGVGTTVTVEIPKAPTR